MTAAVLLRFLLVLLFLAASGAVRAESPVIGCPSRDADFDVLPGFTNPPPGYGEVAFYWWVGDPLDRRRMLWQLEKLAGKGITGIQINYAHTDKGGLAYGLTMPSEPPLFSQQWWELFGWFLDEAKKRGMSVSLSDYTLGVPGQGSFTDEALKENPDLCGRILSRQLRPADGGKELTWQLPEGWLSVVAIKQADGNEKARGCLGLQEFVKDGKLRWTPPNGRWQVVAVAASREETSLDPMNLDSGRAIIKHFFHQFERRFPGECGKGLNFFFSDELRFRALGAKGIDWNDRIVEEFQRRKGYDIRPELAALWMDIGPQTPKIRMDYNDVRVALAEEGYFRPIFDWHQRRGMIYGCDHGHRGRKVDEFGDYFRAMRWNQGPGCDQPRLGRDLIKNKVAASLSHLYRRPRVWLEGFYGSGWGTSSDELADATFVNFLHGHNLLTLHGLYYTTHGGWWEWAPPSNHWRMPYWEHIDPFLNCTRRLSYLFAQGAHVCDVAVIYPVAPTEAGMSGKQSTNTAFDCVETLYRSGTDLDFIDFQSLARAKIDGGRLRVADESYRVLVLPAMKAVRHSTLEKAAEFARHGGIVAAVGALPEASDRIGRDDPEVKRLVDEIFGECNEKHGCKKHAGGGLGVVVKDSKELVGFINRTIPPDIKPAGQPPTAFLHRRVGERDVYGLMGVPKGTPCKFRAVGHPELWNPWTGKTSPLPVLEQTDSTTTVRLPLDARELQLIVFSPGKPLVQVASSRPSPTAIPIEGQWECEVKPTLDNRWGDFRWPPTNEIIGAEIRKFRYRDETTPNPGWEKPDCDDSNWPRVTRAYGPMFQRLGPMPVKTDVNALEADLAASKTIAAGETRTVDGKSYAWTPYDFSWRWGVENDPGHQGYHGLKAKMYDEFIRLGKLVYRRRLHAREPEPGGARYYLWTTVRAPRDMKAKVIYGGDRPSAVWIGGKKCPANVSEIELAAGANPVLLRYDKPATGYFLLAEPDFVMPEKRPGSLSMRWNGAKGILPFDVRPGEKQPAGWYRFRAAPGMKSLTVSAHGRVQCWVDGRAVAPDKLDDGKLRFDLSDAKPREAGVALRIEQQRGLYGGAGLPEPIAMQCGKGLISPGDWSRIEGLESYSGGLWYRKSIALTPEQAAGTVTLDLGRVVSSAEVRVNGRPAGVRVSAPWRWDVSKLVRPGENRIEVLVYNTLANHYLTIPTSYRGSPASGIIGPVSLEVQAENDLP